MSSYARAGLEARGQRPRLGAVVVADPDDLDALELAQHGQVRDLRDRSRADHAHPDVGDRRAASHQYSLTSLVPG